MATAITIDPVWKFELNQATRLLEKIGATRIVVYRDMPNTTYKYTIGYEFNDRLYQAAGDNFPRLVESIYRKLTEAEPKDKESYDTDR